MRRSGCSASAARAAARIPPRAFFWPLLLLQERSYWTLPLGLAQFRGLFQTNWPALTAVVVMATIPILVLYIFFQRYFTAGIAASGVKG